MNSRRQELPMWVRASQTLAFLLLFAPVFSHAEDKKAEWKPLFDGKTLNGWKAINFGGEGETHVEEGELVLEMGTPMTGLTYKGEALPKANYEIEVEAKRVQGIDFFCGCTFPVNDSHCSLIVGGWGGAVVGISSIDGNDASMNDTTKYMKFEKNQWYRFRVRVQPERITCWIDDKEVVNQNLKGHKISTRRESDPSRPFGFCTYETKAALRNIRIRTIADGQ